MSTDGEPAGLYLHIPFCSAVCPYCDFAVLVGGPSRRRRFVETLLDEIGLHAIPFAPIDTIYLGGGTPSLLEPEDLERILDAVRRTFRPLPGTRVYLEANPEDVEPASLAAWRRLGVGFLSLGVQSFDDHELRFLGRRHDARASRRAVELALAAGFDTVAIDLIYSLPDQGADAWRRNLELATSLAPDHLSCYELEIHHRTPFGKRHRRGELAELPDARQAELFELTHRFLADAGYPGYEVSNFARSAEHQSRHNRKYWHHVPYLGLGPSAHSFDGRRRWWNQRLLPPWQRAVRAGERPVAGGESLAPADLALETVMLGLRTTAGIDLRRFEETFGFDLAEHNRAHVQRAVAEGLLGHDDRRLRPTLDGLLRADGLAAGFDVDASREKPAGRGSDRHLLRST